MAQAQSVHFMHARRRREEIAVAYAEHTNLGDYTTAALIWLEQCGRGEQAGRLPVGAA